MKTQNTDPEKSEEQNTKKNIKNPLQLAKPSMSKPSARNPPVKTGHRSNKSGILQCCDLSIVTPCHARWPAIFAALPKNKLRWLTLLTETSHKSRPFKWETCLRSKGQIHANSGSATLLSAIPLNIDWFICDLVHRESLPPWFRKGYDLTNEIQELSYRVNRHISYLDLKKHSGYLWIRAGTRACSTSSTCPNLWPCLALGMRMKGTALSLTWRHLSVIAKLRAKRLFAKFWCSECNDEIGSVIHCRIIIYIIYINTTQWYTVHLFGPIKTWRVLCSLRRDS